MGAISMFVAPQQIKQIHHELSGEFVRALEHLTATLCDMPRPSRSASPREYAELREAKSLISYLRHPDPTEAVRGDELAWALGRVSAACTDGLCTAMFGKAAHMLGIDLSQPHPMPADLNRRISNELQFLSPRAMELPMAEAV